MLAIAIISTIGFLIQTFEVFHGKEKRPFGVFLPTIAVIAWWDILSMLGIISLIVFILMFIFYVAEKFSK